MLSQLFLGLSLVGAEWVLYFLVLVSILSVALILERSRFYLDAGKGLKEFRERVRTLVLQGKWTEALQTARGRLDERAKGRARDLEVEMAVALLSRNGEKEETEVLEQIAQSAMMGSKLRWESNLAILATIGSNSPFVGLFGTVLGIIKAFHDLSQHVGAGAQTVTAGISEALVATAFGILVAIPAVVAFNLFQRKVKAARTEAEALKCFLIGTLSGRKA